MMTSRCAARPFVILGVPIVHVCREVIKEQKGKRSALSKAPLRNPDISYLNELGGGSFMHMLGHRWTSHLFIVADNRVSCVAQDRPPTIEVRRESSIQLPSGSRIIDIRATSPSVMGARPSRTPLLRSAPCTASISAICRVM